MKISKKGLLAVATLPVLAAGIVIGAANANTFNFARANAATRVDTTIEIAEDVSKAGNALYLAIPEGSTWYDAGAKFAVRFVDTVNDKSAWTDFITGANWIGKDAYNTNIYESVVPSEAGVTTWTNMQVFRFDPSQEEAKTSINWGTGSYHSINAAKNQIKVPSTVNDTSENYTTSAAERIAFWANAASQWTSSGICDADGATDTEDLTTSWNATKTTYAAIKGADVKDYFKHTEGVKDSPTKALDTMARYDWIYQRYHTALSLEDFAHRFVAE